MFVKVTKISQKLKTQKLVEYRKNIIEREKTLYYDYKEVF